MFACLIKSTGMLMLLVVLALCTPGSLSFVLPGTTTPRRCHASPSLDRTPSPLYFFRRGGSDDNDKKNKDESDEEKSGGFLPFLARKLLGIDNNDDNKSTVVDPPKSPAPPPPPQSPKPVAAVREPSKPVPVTSPAPVPKSMVPTNPAVPSLSPQEQATKYRAEAEKVRLEAERMDAELTLQKIERLEKELQVAKTREGKSATKDVDELQRAMELLQAKLRGEVVAVVAKPSPTSTATKTSMKSRSAELATIVAPIVEEELDDTIESMEMVPNFLKKALASAVELEYDNAEDINNTELAIRLDQLSRMDFSFSNRPAPAFTEEEIEERKKELRNDKRGWWVGSRVDETVLKAAGDNETKLALFSLEYDYYMDSEMDLTLGDLDKILKDEEWLKPMVDAFNKSAVDGTVETLYPKCTRKNQEPTLAQLQQLVADVLAKVPFKVTAKPEAVAGGYIVRGTTKAKSGDELIDAIDKQLSKSPLADKMTVLYTGDFSIFSDPDAFETYDPDDIPPILYITGPDIVRPPRRILLTITSALGLATSWYLAIYPFLLNSAIAKRVEEELSLADAGMTPDLTWLSDLSIPLFWSFIGIQLMHEAGHQIVATANKVKLTVPVLVPSLITGITSSVTTFKNPPKNKEAMFDISVAGPLLGMLASLAAIAIGSQLTLGSDASMLPALPLDILRQSTLGGGIINAILGDGALGVPEGAVGTPAVASITIPLHPVALAGYISLVVNALSVLPIGTTDGGRMAIALFGRGAKLLVGNLFLIALFTVGLLGSDLFLFYFAFVIAVQSGNEIPAKNEVDKVGFSRVLMATATYVIAFASLIPFQ